MTGLELLLRKIWLRGLQNGEKGFTLTLESKAEVYRMRTKLYALRKKVLAAGHDPEAMQAMNECSIHYDVKAKTLTIVPQLSTDLGNRLTAQVMAGEGGGEASPVAESLAEEAAEASIKRLMGEFDEPLGHVETPYYGKRG